jgi:hypothetical protein
VVKPRKSWILELWKLETRPIELEPANDETADAKQYGTATSIKSKHVENAESSVNEWRWNVEPSRRRSRTEPNE